MWNITSWKGNCLLLLYSESEIPWHGLKMIGRVSPHKPFRKIRIKKLHRKFKQGHPGLFVSQSVVSYSWHTCWDSYKSTWIVLCHRSVPWKRSRRAGRMTVCPAPCPSASSHVLMLCPYASEHIQTIIQQNMSRVHFLIWRHFWQNKFISLCLPIVSQITVGGKKQQKTLVG